jgi:hypothetical protein
MSAVVGGARLVSLTLTADPCAARALVALLRVKTQVAPPATALALRNRAPGAWRLHPLATPFS